MWLLNNYKEKLEYILEDTTIEIDNIPYIDPSKEIPLTIFKILSRRINTTIEIDNITYIDSSKEIPQTIFKILSRRINIPFTTELFEFI